MIRFRSMLALAAVAVALLLVAADANARVGGGFSGGSRGSRTFSAPPATRTAPSPAAPIQRSVTQPNTPATVGAASSAARPGFFGSGLMGGLAAGFLGAGLFGLLFGSGMFAGLGGLSSVLGLMLQIALVAIVATLALQWWRRRSTPALAGPAAAAHAYDRNETGAARGGGFGAMFGGGGFSGGAAPSGEPITIGKSDFDDFERLLGDIQAAYGAEDLTELRTLVTPEMLSYFAEGLTANASRGEINRVADVKLLQGDLAEAWREGGNDYATVDMRFSLDDRMVERASGRELSGGPQEVTEVWTFVRASGGAWLLSAIQQA